MANTEAHRQRPDRDSVSELAPLDAARNAFGWLVRGPGPVCLDGRLFPGLPNRRLRLDQVRDRLLHRRCPQAARDAVWAHLVLRSRTEGATWTVGCVGVALPALTRTAARLTARFAGDVSDIHAAVLTGFIAELTHVDVSRPRVMLRLRWAAYRAGHTAVREALGAPQPAGTRLGSTAPNPPSGHPDFVLVRAVADGVLSPSEAELIGATRLEGISLAGLAEARGVGYPALHQSRRRAERRLAAYLRDDAPAADRHADPATQVLDALAITDAAQAATAPPALSPRRVRKAGGRVSKTTPESGVQGCGGPPPAPTAPPPTDRPSQAADPGGPEMHPSEPSSPTHHDTAQPAGKIRNTRRRRRARSARKSNRRGDARRTSSATAARPARRNPQGHVAVIAALAAGALLLGPFTAEAQTSDALALADSVDQVLANIRSWLMGILAGLATVFLTVGGVRYLMAGGDPGEVEKAKTAFRAAGIGYALAALAPLLVSILQGIVGA